MARWTYALVWALCAVGCTKGDDSAGPSNDAGEEGEQAAATDGGSSGGTSHDADPCPGGVLDGDYEATADEDIAAIASCTEITGTLTVSGDVTALQLDSLTTIGGMLRVMDTAALTRVELPALLTVVGGGCTFTDNTGLVAVILPALEKTSGLALVRNTALAEVDAHAINECGYVGVQFEDALPSFSAPALKLIGAFIVNNNASLVSLRFDKLETIQTDGFLLSSNPVLTTLGLPLLTSVFGEIGITNNPMLPLCQLEAIRMQIDDPNLQFSALGNDDEASCP